MNIHQNQSLRAEWRLQGNMHHFEDKVPIHGCPVNILQFDRWTWCAVCPANMSTDKALDVLRSR
jgi:hypothetical protein